MYLTPLKIKNKTPQLLNFLQDSDLVCLQETRFKNPNESAYFDMVFKKHFNTRISFAKAEDAYSGLVILVKLSPQLILKGKIFELDGTAVAIMCELGKQLILVIGVFLPADHQKRVAFLETLSDKFNNNFVYHDECIILGDFKFVENPIDRSYQRINNRQFGIDGLNSIKRTLHIEDVYRAKKPQCIEFSFFSSLHKTQS